MPKLTVRPIAALLAATLFSSPAFADQPKPWGLWMQEPASPIMAQLEALNATLTGIITVIVAVVFALLGYIILRFRASRNPVPASFTHNTRLEVVWTLVPVLILVFIAFPSFRLLFAMDRAENPDLTLSVTGHQWYWSYSFPDLKVSFDSNIDEDKQPRLLGVDNPLVLPVGAKVRVLLTAEDVVHSWAVPALGVKTDAIPGRQNETWFSIDRPGTYYGQCSQLCGINHGFMPIEIQAVDKPTFEAWIAEHQAKQTSSAAPAQPAAATN
jgi:cytochrome c oxidase subunit 2